MILTVYQAEDLRAQFTCSHEGTPAPGTPAVIEGTSTHTDQDHAKGEGEEKGEEEKGGEKGQYLNDREKNIEKNRELLAPFFEALGEGKEGEQAIKKKKEGKTRKTTKAEKAKEKGLAVIARIKDKRK